MDMSVFVIMIVSWITKKFPSLQEYAEYVGPTAVALLTAFGIFTNLLPEPGHKYAVPDTSELEKELGDSGRFIIRMAKFTRSIVISVNWFLATVVYKGFYIFTNKISSFIPKLGKKKTV